MKGDSFEDAKYYYFLEYIEQEDLEDFFLVILNSLVEEMLKDNHNLKIQEPIEPLLNIYITGSNAFLLSSRKKMYKNKKS